MPPRPNAPLSTTALALSLALALAWTPGCGGDPGEAGAPTESVSGEGIAPGAPATSLELPGEIASPDRPVTSVEAVEDETEALADSLIEFAEVLRKRQFDEAREWFSPELVAHAAIGHAEASRAALPLGVERIKYDVGASSGVGRDGFIDSLRVLLGEWRSVDSMLWR